MKSAFAAVVLVSMSFGVAGCSRGGDPIDYGVGSASESSGTGGEGSGPTGTGGGLPADNPAADAPPADDTSGNPR
jgi:hypothetical protein